MNEPHLASAEFGGFWIRFLAVLVDSADAVHLGEDAAFGILRHNGFCLLVVQVKAVADDGFVVVAPARFLGPAQEAGHEFLIVGRQLQDDVELLLALGKDVVEVVHLGGGARVPVQQEAAGDVGLAEPVADHLVGYAVGNEIAGIHVLLGLDAKRCFALNVRPENVAGGDCHNAEAL